MNATTINWDAIDLFIRNGGGLEIDGNGDGVNIIARNSNFDEIGSSYGCESVYEALEIIISRISKAVKA